MRPEVRDAGSACASTATEPDQLSIPFIDPAPSAGFASLGSGSRGNGTLIALGGERVLIDCGFTLKEVEARLARLGVAPAELSAILVTHEHSDHIQGVARLARRYRIPVYASAGTIDAYRDWRDVAVRRFMPGRRFAVGAIEVSPVPVPHDAREPTQFVLEANGRRIGVLTDLGEAPASVLRGFAGCDGLLVEANHDRTMLWTGNYPYVLKRRIAGPLGHLANEQTRAFLSALDLNGNAAVLLGHLSQENNALALLEVAFARLRERFSRLAWALQDVPTPWEIV